MTGSLLVKNVWVADGTGSPLRKSACLVDDEGRIGAVEKDFSACAARRQLDGKGLILAPGFIDAHGHSDISAPAAPECFSKVSQGVTTEVCGNCGLSPFPLTEENRAHLQELYANYGVKMTWNSCREYIRYCNNAQCRLSLVPLCGHNTLRAAVCGYAGVEAGRAEIEQMCRLLEETFSEGAGGISFGLLYTPGIFAAPEEIAELMRVAARHGKVCTAHLRSEGDELLESVSEMLSLSFEAGLKHFHFSHLKTAGVENFGKLEKIFELFDEARSRGLKITCDRYPYIESMTQLSVSLPGKWKKLDDGTLKKILADPEETVQVLNELWCSKTEKYWQRCRLVNTTHPRFASYRGRKITDIPGDFCENVIELLKFDPVNTQCAFSVMSEANMKHIISQPFCVAGSDGNALPADGTFGHSHPRSFGAVAKFVRLCLDLGVPIEESVRKVSGLTAEIFHLDDRGVITPGRRGDLVLFDPDAIDCRGDFLSPETPAEGIGVVVKNGEIIYS